MKDQKILLLSENFPPIPGGSGRWFWELYSRLPRSQVVTCAHDANGAAQFDASHDMDVKRFNLKSAEWGLLSFSGLMFYIRTAFALRRLVKSLSITHIHCGRVIHEGISAWLLHQLTGMPYVCYVHGEDVETAATSREHSFLVRQVCKKAYRIICNSENSAAILKRLGFASTEKVSVLHPGVDAKRFVPAHEDKIFKQIIGWQDRQVILTVGRLQERKGQDRMVQAMSDIISVFPRALYVIIGDGECKRDLEKLSDELNLNEHIQFLTDIDDVQMIKCYQQCDVFILPNRTIGNDIEGFGMVLVEAQSCGKPVIAGDSGGTRETMLVGESGFIIDCTKPQTIAKKIIELLSAPNDLQAMGALGRQHVLNSLDWRAHVERAKSLF